MFPAFSNLRINQPMKRRSHCKYTFTATCWCVSCCAAVFGVVAICCVFFQGFSGTYPHGHKLTKLLWVYCVCFGPSYLQYECLESVLVSEHECAKEQLYYSQTSVISSVSILWYSIPLSTGVLGFVRRLGLFLFLCFSVFSLHFSATPWLVYGQF